MSSTDSEQEKAVHLLSGRYVLIVEDEYFLANDLERGFEEIGVITVGPVPSLEQAMALVQESAIDLAVLDIALSGDKVYDVADVLIERNVPVLFVTGYDRSDIPSRYADVPMCQKPVSNDKVIAALARIITQ